MTATEYDAWEREQMRAMTLEEALALLARANPTKESPK